MRQNLAFSILSEHDIINTVSCFSRDVVKSLDVLDKVIGEFDDGFLSEVESIRVKQVSNNTYTDKIDRVFDCAEETKLGKLNNFQIKDKHGETVTDQSDIPAPGTVEAAKRQYLDNLVNKGHHVNIRNSESRDKSEQRVKIKQRGSEESDVSQVGHDHHHMSEETWKHNSTRSDTRTLNIAAQQ